MDKRKLVLDIIVIACLVFVAVAFILLVIGDAESACGGTGDIECPGGPPKPYPGPGPTPPHVPTSEVPDPYPAPVAGSVPWYKVWLPSVLRSK